MFNLLAKHPDMKCHVSDLNSDLILAYLAIRDKVTEVIESLENHSKKYEKKNKGREAARAVLSVLGILKNESK